MVGFDDIEREPRKVIQISPSYPLMGEACKEIHRAYGKVYLFCLFIHEMDFLIHGRNFLIHKLDLFVRQRRFVIR